MGARISIRLADCFGHPNVSVNIFDEVLEAANDGEETTSHTVACLVFETGENCTNTHRWPLDCCPNDGKITLEADFNFFRDPDRHMENMRMLYEHSIPFFVIPG